MRTQTVGETLAQLLLREGVRHIFGIPGVHTLEVYRGLATTPEITHVTARHEQGAAFMADGYARAGGAPGVCCVITGPGVANAATAIATAYSDSVPVLVLCGQLASSQIGSGLGLPHELIDQGALIRAITGGHERPTTQAELEQAVGGAFVRFESERPQPIVIELPLDLQRQPSAGILPSGTIGAHQRVPLPNSTNDVANVLQAAMHPVVVAGGGAQSAGSGILELARRIGAPIVLSSSGKGAVPADDPLVIGCGLDLAAVQAALAASDVAFVVGCRVDPIDVDHDRPVDFLPPMTIQVDIDESRLGANFPIQYGLAGAASGVVDAIVDRLDPVHDQGPALARARLVRDAARREALVIAGQYGPWIEAINDAKPRDGVTVVDVTRPVSYAAPYLLDVATPRSWLRPQGMNALGYAVPAAIGAKLAVSDRSVLAIVGDGGFMFSGMELIVASELGLTLPVVVWNDGRYGEIHHYMVKDDSVPLGTEILSPDFRMLGRSLGAATATVGSPAQLRKALASAWRAHGPTLIEVDAHGIA